MTNVLESTIFSTISKETYSCSFSVNIFHWRSKFCVGFNSVFDIISQDIWLNYNAMAFKFHDFPYYEYLTQSHVNNHYNIDVINKKCKFLQNGTLSCALIRFSADRSSKMYNFGKTSENIFKGLMCFLKNGSLYILKIDSKNLFIPPNSIWSLLISLLFVCRKYFRT